MVSLYSTVLFGFNADLFMSKYANRGFSNAVLRIRGHFVSPYLFDVRGKARVCAFGKDLPTFRSFGQQTEAWVNDKIIMDCPDSRVVREVEKMAYHVRNILSVRTLLLLDDTTCRHETVQDAHRNTEVVFLSPNTVFLIHPLDWEISQPPWRAAADGAPSEWPKAAIPSKWKSCTTVGYVILNAVLLLFFCYSSSPLCF